MTIEKALEGAENVRKKLLTENIRTKDIKDAANIIEGLVRIVYWYDANQRRLIKTVRRLTKRAKALNKVLETYLHSGDTDGDY